MQSCCIGCSFTVACVSLMYVSYTAACVWLMNMLPAVCHPDVQHSLCSLGWIGEQCIAASLETSVALAPSHEITVPLSPSLEITVPLAPSLETTARCRQLVQCPPCIARLRYWNCNGAASAHWEMRISSKMYVPKQTYARKCVSPRRCMCPNRRSHKNAYLLEDVCTQTDVRTEMRISSTMCCTCSNRRISVWDKQIK